MKPRSAPDIKPESTSDQRVESEFRSDIQPGSRSDLKVHETANLQSGSMLVERTDLQLCPRLDVKHESRPELSPGCTSDPESRSLQSRSRSERTKVLRLGSKSDLQLGSPSDVKPGSRSEKTGDMGPDLRPGETRSLRSCPTSVERTDLLPRPRSDMKYDSAQQLKSGCRSEESRDLVFESRIQEPANLQPGPRSEGPTGLQRDSRSVLRPESRSEGGPEETGRKQEETNQPRAAGTRTR